MGLRPHQFAQGAIPTLKKERLLSIVEYAQQAARMRQNPAVTVAVNRLHEHQAQGLPGFRCNPFRPEDEDELWFSVERLHETKPPEADNRWVGPWLAPSNSPTGEPSLRESAAGQALI